MLSIQALKYLAKTRLMKDDEVQSFFEQRYFLDKKMQNFSDTIKSIYPKMKIPAEILTLIVEYEDDENKLHYNYKCNISPKLLSKCYGSTSLILLKLLRITSNIMFFIAFSWYLLTWHNKQNQLYRGIRDKFVKGKLGTDIQNLRPVPPNFDSANLNLSFSEKLSRAYKVNPFNITKPTIPLSKYLILPFPPTPNIDLKWNINKKYWNKRYNLLAFVTIWYLFEVLYNYINDKLYNDFSQITQYLTPKYSNTKYAEISSNKQKKKEEKEEDIDKPEEMCGTLKALYWKWRCMFHNNHHERFDTNTDRLIELSQFKSHYFLVGNSLVALALLHNCIMPMQQLLGWIFKNRDFYNGNYWFLSGKESLIKRITYYLQSCYVYSYKYTSTVSSCAVACLFWYLYPKSGLSGNYFRHTAPTKMISRNQIRHKHKNLVTKTLLLLSSLPYANNFTSLMAVFFYGLFLGENIEYLIDSETQFRAYIDYRLNKLNQMNLNLNVKEMNKLRNVIRKQYDHKPIARLIPLLFHITSLILTYSLIGTPERLQIQAVRAYKSRMILARIGMISFMFGLIGHLGNASYIQSGYYYHFPKTYSYKYYPNDVKQQKIVYHPPPRDIFEWVSLGLIQYEDFVWRCYHRFSIISDSIYRQVVEITNKFDSS